MYWHSSAGQECAFEWSFPCHPLLAMQDGCQHQPGSSQMKLNRKVAPRGHTCCAPTKGGHCLGPTRASPEKTLKNIQCGHESPAAFFSLYRPVSFETTCFYRCSLWMPGAPEILQFNSRVNSSSQYVFLEAFRGTCPILEREVITV